MTKDLRCFFKNHTLYCSQEVWNSLRENAVWEPELPINAARIARNFGVTVEVKPARILDDMEKDYHQSLHMKAVKDMTENVEALAELFRRNTTFTLPPVSKEGA